MKIRELKEILYGITKRFWDGCDVVWVDSNSQEPTMPFITLRVRNMASSDHGFHSGEEDVYDCHAAFEVNLYTMGKKRTHTEYENTAEDDLMDFIRWLESPEVSDILTQKNIALLPAYPIQDLSGIFENVRYRYRAMAQMTVYFQQSTKGAYSLFGEELPNTSKGGLKAFSEEEMEYIEEVELIEGDE